MIGLTILAVIIGYILLSKYIVSKIKEKKYKYTMLAILILIPTWDVILGFPVYAYLCMTKSGPKIYQTVENVEGFYVGEQERQFQPYEPYTGYRYIDYKEVNNRKPTGKHYRSYWIDYRRDTDKSQYCVYPRYPNSLSHPYTKAFNSGRCIVKEEILESKVSRWDTSWSLQSKQNQNYHPINIPLLGVSVSKVGEIRDTVTNKILSEQYYVTWDRGWISVLFTSIETGNPKIKFCGGDYSDVFELEHKTLILKGEK